MTRHRSAIGQDTDELCCVGADASPRPEVVEAARAALVPSAPVIDSRGGLEDSEAWQIGRAMFQHAKRLRMSGRSEQAVPLYLDALVRFESVGRLGDMSACLTGAGLAYLELAKATLRNEIVSSLDGGLISIYALARQVITQRTLDFADKSRLSHVWALEIQKELGSLGGQAGRIANLAITEKLLGNLDTARRYIVWALNVDRAGADRDALRIDLRLLADIDRALGDEAAAAQHEYELEGLNAPSV